MIEAESLFGALRQSAEASVVDAIRRFVRWELGEGIEKKKEDYAAEVAKMASETH